MFLQKKTVYPYFVKHPNGEVPVLYNNLIRDDNKTKIIGNNFLRKPHNATYIDVSSTHKNS